VTEILSGVAPSPPSPPPPTTFLGAVPRRAALLSAGLNWLVERICALLLVLLILDVWLGVLVRYVIDLPITFTEELARYLMIWAALLAVSCGIARRAHVGVLVVLETLPQPARRALEIAFDLIAFGFFALLFVYGIGFAESGGRQFTMIYDMTKFWPHLAVPVAAALCCVQLLLVALSDLGWLLAREDRA